jgi:hypothetical protein
MNAYEIANEVENEVYAGSHGQKTVADFIRQQADRIAELEKENSNLKYEISSGAWQPKEATDQELFNTYAHLQDTYEGDNFPVALGRTILKLYTTPQDKADRIAELEKQSELVSYSDFLPIWKHFIADARSVLNVQMVAHHFYNLGLRTTPQTKPLDYQEVINSLKELIAPKEPDWDCSYWNQAIERCILKVEMLEAKVRGEK